ncbi:MAG: DoxX family membrane protein [Acidiferrobacter sp.]
MTVSCMPGCLGACRRLGRTWAGLVRVLEWLQSPALLAARLYVAQVFLRSGLQSLRNWGATVWLYQHEFHIVVLPPMLAAVLGTAGEVVLPLLLVLGLFGRLGALGLFVVNAVALLSVLYAVQQRRSCIPLSGASCL